MYIRTCLSRALGDRRIEFAPHRLNCMPDVTISFLSAQVTDYGAVYRLLEDVPLSEEICAGLCRPYFARRWDGSRERSFWLSSDGTTVTRLSVTGLNVDETVAIWVCYDDYLSLGGLECSAAALREIIRRELDVHAKLEG